MKKQDPASEAVPPSAGQSACVIVEVRRALGMTQSEFADVLGVSARAVQSYEQGWRAVPFSTYLHMFAVLASARRSALGDKPCWEVTGCPESKRAACRSPRLNSGLFCWLVAGRSCGGRGGRKKGQPQCADCPVIRRLLAGSTRDSQRSR